MPLYPTDYLCDFCKKAIGDHTATALFCTCWEKITPEESYFSKANKEAQKRNVEPIGWILPAGVVYKIPIGVGCEHFEVDEEKYENDPRTKEEN